VSGRLVLNENNLAVVALLVEFAVGVVVGFDGAFAVFIMMFGPYLRTSERTLGKSR
jgi:hypothetical protein